MPQILRTTLVQDVALAASGQIKADLPVNPLSFILLTIRALNNNAANAAHHVWAELLTMINKVSVTYRGASIISGRAIDLALMYACISKWSPRQMQANDVDNDVRGLTMPLLFGRRPYDVTECFPATRRGDLSLTLDAAAALPTALDGFTIQVETVELLDAQPAQFLKVTETQRTMQLGDQNEIALPLGNRLLSLLLQAVTFPTAASFNSTFGSVAIELDNVEVIMSRANWESMTGELNRVLPGGWPLIGHTHKENVAGAYAQFAATREQAEDDAAIQPYAYIDLDPTGDGSLSIDTSNAADFNLLVNSDVTDGTPSRVLIAEQVAIAGAGAAA
jgi:hypothetical protein